MGEAGGGDGGDTNFVEKVGGSAGPLRSPFHQGGDGFQDWRRWVFVEGVKDGLAMGGECGNGPLGGIRGSGQGALPTHRQAILDALNENSTTPILESITALMK